MEYSDKNLIVRILQLVKNNGNIQNIISENVSFSMVYAYIRQLKRNGLITDIYGELELTPLGLKKIEELNEEFGRKHSEKWISPQSEYLIEKWDKFRVYLP
ncbi:winged helix-turn-helix domain-containing protein [Bacillus badius]|uniref:winged helix-turn-helix domain-containing protein n=1 Tax=Bacillus badius TaxID=1455 RepID=UPI002E1D40A6|nr:winged helix-turn-helix domain-containing protein [Bacillus badius]